MPQANQQDIVNLTKAINTLTAAITNMKLQTQTNATKAANKAKASAAPSNSPASGTTNAQQTLNKQAQVNGNTTGTTYANNFANAFQKKIKAANVSVNFGKYIMGGLKRLFSGIMSLVGFIISIIGMLWQKLIEMWEWYEGVLRKIYDATGLVGAEAERVRGIVVGVTNQYVKLGVTMESAAQAAGAITEEFGNIGALTSNTLGTVSLLKTTMGVAESEGAKLVKIFMSMSKYSEAQTKSTIASIKEMAIMAKVAPRKIMQDIAKNSEFIYKYFRGSKENATKFAVIINSIGKTMDLMKGAADSLMEWDSSIENEMNASVLLGRTVDFSAARMKVFKGDMAGALEDIIKQVGSADKLSKMSIYQHKAIADATGMSTEALIEMVSMQEKMNAFEKGYGKLAGKSIAEQKKLLEIAKKRGDVNAEAILTQNIQQTQVEKFKAMQEELKMKFLTLAQKFFPIILKVIDGLGIVFNYVGEGIKKVVAALSGAGIASIGNDISQLIASIGKFMVDVVVDIILWIISHQDDIVAFFRAVRKFVVDELIPALKDIWDKLKGIGAAVESFFGMFVSGDATTNKQYWYDLGFAIGAVIIGLKAIPLIKVFGSMIKSAWDATVALNATSAAATTTASTASTAGSGIAAFLTNLGIGLWQLLQGIALGIGSFAAAAPGIGIFGAFMIIVTGSVIGLAYALQLVTPLIIGLAKVIGETLVNMMYAFANSIKTLSEIPGGRLAGLAGELILLGLSLSSLAIGMSAAGIASFFGGTGFLDDIIKLGDYGDKINKTADAINKLSMYISNIKIPLASGVLSNFADELIQVNNALSGVGTKSFFSNIFGGDSLIDQIKELSQYNDSINKTAISMSALKKSFTNFSLPTLNDDALDNIKDLIESVSELSAESKFVVNSHVEVNNKELVKKLDDLIQAVSDMKVVMDYREVGRILGKNQSGAY